MLPVRLLSDLHLEFGPLNLPIMENEHEQVLVLAGDICVAIKPQDVSEHLKEWQDRFRHIIYIMGNHEHYNGYFWETKCLLEDMLFWNNINNVTIAENEVIHIDDVSFICATLWTDYNKNDPYTKIEAARYMNDFRIIYKDQEVYQKNRFLPDDAYEVHVASRNFIFNNIMKEKEAGQKTFVVTHHAPTHLSIHPRYIDQHKLNGAYVSDLSEEILDTQPDIWVHGHTHDNHDYVVGKTRIVCNPRGYEGYETNPNFDKQFLIEV